MAETVIAGRYRLDEMLGRGGMSEVWCATDSELGRRVALKLLAPNADTARFEREARAVAALAHPNVNQLYDYGEADGRPFMVLEYLPGGTLEDRLRASGAPLPDAETEATAADIARGLAHAHSRGVVHRDLKPTNVLFDEEGRAKLADFGIARLTAGEGTLTEAGTVLGTAAYLSPEQAVGAPATAASDVYSFGVILFRMLTGRLPFESNDPLELVALHRDVEAPPVASIRPDAPPALEAAVTASLAKDPAERPQNGAELLATLGAAEGTGLAAAPVFATDQPTRVMTPPPPPRERRGSLFAFAALLVLALAGAGLAYALTQPSDSPSAPPASSVKSISLPTTTRRHRTTTTAPTTATKPKTTTTAPTTTAPTTTFHAATVRTTVPATTTAPPPPTTTAPTTTLPATTAPTTTAPAPQPTASGP